MLRRLVAVVTIPAVLTGLVLAPHAHVHAAGTAPGSDADHRHRGSAGVKHAHVTSHAPAPFEGLDAGEREDGDTSHEHEGPTIAFDPAAFAFQLKAAPRSPSPSVLAGIVGFAPPAVAVLVDSVLHPPGHGPPVTLAAPRAPPSAPPAAA
jgi:hypothetical protein